jgi:hypothetical protein
MADHDPAYTATLAGQLVTRRPDLLELAEDELAVLNEAIALDIRQHLAHDLHLPEPTQ